MLPVELLEPPLQGFALLARGRLSSRHEISSHCGVLGRDCPFGDCDDREGAACGPSGGDGGGDRFYVIGNLGDENHVGSRRHACAEGEPAHRVPHHLDHHDPVVAVGGRVEPVDGFGGDPHRRVEAEGHVRSGHVVVDRLGKCEHRHAYFVEFQAIPHRSVAAQADQRLQLVLLDDLLHEAPHVLGLLLAHVHAGDLGPTRPEDGPATGQDPAQIVRAEMDESVLHQPDVSVEEADNLHAVCPLGRLPHRPYRCVESGAVSA